MITSKLTRLSATETGITFEGKDIEGLGIIVTISGPPEQVKRFAEGKPLVLVVPDEREIERRTIEKSRATQTHTSQL